ncbi:MAG: HAMP domain-containing histidine kinase [Epsilonproteobacteria bacterium]|nr:HAMP domain-containing histidine kinase [Campylobacterota bacterium]
MKNISVTTFIHLIFLLAIAVLVATLIALLESSADQREFQKISRYKIIADTFLTNPDAKAKSKEVTILFKRYQLTPISIKDVKKEIEDRGEVIFSGRSILGSVRVFDTKENVYIYVQRFDYDLMLKDNKPGDYTTQMLFTAAGILFIVLIVTYWMVLKKLAPLKRLHKEIESFAQGNLDVKITYSGDDEIARIAKSFEKAIKHIKQLISSKNLFMRNIMHELKTPITKGRIIAETIEDEVAKRILINAFERMNELINDLAQIERITIYSFTPKLSQVNIKEIIDEAIELTMRDKEHFIVNVNDLLIYTDKDLLALAIKNIIDNGVKYSPNKKVKIILIGNRIEFRSKGEPLKHDLSYYTEPFSQEEKRQSGFGLGLYIVANVLDKLKYQLRYRYDKEKGENIFEIILN